MIGRQNRLAGWQFYQCVDAIRILYCAQLSSPACKDVDWEFWRNSARQLDIDHPSTARQLTPEELSYLKEKNSTGPLQKIRSVHRDLLVCLASEIRRRDYAYRTEQTYEQWVCRFILYCKDVEPEQAGADEVRSFLEYLAIRRQVSSSTQNQALSALVFFFDNVLKRNLGEMEAFVRAKRTQNLPVVLSRKEIMAILAQLQGIHKLLVSLLYGTGMRLLEGLRLRVQDIDFSYRRIHVHQAKGKKDRYVPLPDSLVKSLRAQIEIVEQQHNKDLAAGYGNSIQFA